MRQVCILALAATLAACATEPQAYRPSGNTGPAWTIGGDFNSVTYDLRVLVNGEPAAVGNLWYTDTPRMVSGSYEGHPVRAECVDYPAHSGGILMVLCDVYIDGVRAAFLMLD